MYGNYLFRQREREKNVQRWLPQLTQKGLESLAMSYDKSLSAILKNSGFRSIARAIREATVNAQRRHSQENDSTYEVRYGLGNELLRKIHQREAFMQALSEFIYQYNAETAREEEKRAQKEGGRRLTSEDYRRYRLRYPVTTADLEQFTALLDSYPTELVASMLVAYGYSRRETPRSEETDQDQSYDQPSDSSDDAEQESE
jgi:CRISPR/Cas system CSM-associated protein Csm2 small subunit